MITRDEILSADAEETLIEVIATAHYSQREALAQLLSEMHNSGEVNLLAASESSQLDTISGPPFYQYQSVFCLTLPHIQCRAETAMTVSTRIHNKAGADGSANKANEALREWFRQDPKRIEEGLAVINRDMDSQFGTVVSLLLAGAEHDAERFTAVALDLSKQPQSQIRSAALQTLGRVVPHDDECLLQQALDRFREVVDASHSDQDMAVAVEAALHLLNRFHGRKIDDVRSLLKEACGTLSPLLQRALCHSLENYKSVYDETMIDMTFSALQSTNKEDINTVQAIDYLLYQWDIDADRERIFRFLSNLLCDRDEAIEFNALDNLRHRMQNEKGEILGWYVVSLLLTGDAKLCTVTEDLLPYNETREGLDIDLGTFALEPRWIAYLSRKILGYCLIYKQGAAALLLSCLRAAPESNRAEIEDLIYDHFLMNDSTAIECFEDIVSEDEPARKSVSRLSQKLKSYVDAISKLGTCPAFSPSEREQQLQGYRQTEFWRNIQKQAEESSEMAFLAHKLNILYGTTCIIYFYPDDKSTPQRKEITMTEREYVVDFPRLEVLDPVSQRLNIHRFRSEAPPT